MRCWIQQWKKEKGLRKLWFHSQVLSSIWKSHFPSLDLFPYLYNRERVRLASGPVYPKGLCFCDKGQRSCQSTRLRAGNPFPPFKTEQNELPYNHRCYCNCSFLLHFLKHGPRGKNKDSYRSPTDTRIHRSTLTGTHESDRYTSSWRHRVPNWVTQTIYPVRPNLSIDRGMPQQVSLIVPQEREFTKETKTPRSGRGRAESWL